jgi:hypothetical protein
VLETRLAIPEGSPYYDSPELVHRIRRTWEIMRNHRASSGLEERLLKALRAFTGSYDPSTLAEIRKFGGSDVYARVIATKARGATALLRDIYFSGARPWQILATPKPTLPDDSMATAAQLLQAEVMELQAQGVQVSEAQIAERMAQLEEAIRKAEKQKADDEAKKLADMLDDILTEGEFYDALSQILVDIPYFPFVVLKGPSVRITKNVAYVDGVPVVQETPTMYWSRVSPFDFFWTPGVSKLDGAETCERLRWTRRDLSSLLGLAGWNEAAVRQVLEDYDHGLSDWVTGTDAERARYESREDPGFNSSGIIDALEYHGYASGKELIELKLQGFLPEVEELDEHKEYAIGAWLVGNTLLKVHVNPAGVALHPYNITSYDKVPGTPVGVALPDMLEDVQQIANSILRALNNNIGIASGPQVVVVTDRLAADADADELYPWKRWLVQSEAFGQASGPPLTFYQPESRAQELLSVYQQITLMADDISGIPRYVTGSGTTGGAGRTASGLSMLMQNASKILQQVAHNIDQDIIQATLKGLFSLLMATDAGAMFRGDEKIVVNGVTKLISKEAERMRQLEFLSLTSNPVDLQILGLTGRAELLRALAEQLNLPAAAIVPSRDEVAARQAEMLQSTAAQAAAQGDQPTPSPPGNDDRQDGAQNTNVVQPNYNMRGS